MSDSCRHLLLITDAFPPEFAPRMGALCKWLKGNTDWRITALHFPTENNENDDHPPVFQCLAGYADAEYDFEWENGIHGWSWGRLIRHAVTGQLSMLRFLRIFVSKTLYRIFHIAPISTAKKVVDQVLSQSHYDIILCSETAIDLHRLAYYASRKARIPFVMDVRDIAEEHECAARSWNLRMRLRRHLRTRIFSKAAHVVTVATKMTEVLREFDPNFPGTIIYNGFDADIFNPVRPNRTEKFYLIYIGSYYSSISIGRMRDFITGLSNFLSRHTEASDVGLLFYSARTLVEREIMPMMNAAVRRIVEIKKSVPYSQVPSILVDGSVCVVCGVDDRSRVDAISTKIFEYMAVNRPILDVGDAAISEQERIVADAKAGIVANSPEKVFDFLEAKYAEWKRNGVVCGSLDEKTVAKYSRQEESAAYFRLLSNIIEGMCERRTHRTSESK